MNDWRVKSDLSVINQFAQSKMPSIQIRLLNDLHTSSLSVADVTSMFITSPQCTVQITIKITSTPVPPWLTKRTVLSCKVSQTLLLPSITTVHSCTGLTECVTVRAKIVSCTRITFWTSPVSFTNFLPGCWVASVLIMNCRAIYGTIYTKLTWNFVFISGILTNLITMKNSFSRKGVDEMQISHISDEKS